MDLLVQLRIGIRKASQLVSKARLPWERRAWRMAAYACVAVALPVSAWLMGNGVASIVPRTYCSTAMLRLPSTLDTSAMKHERERLRSSEVLALAVQSLPSQPAKSPSSMDAYLLWSNLEAETVDGGNDIRLAVRGADAASAQLKLQAIVNAYQTLSSPVAGGTAATNIHYVSPPEAYQIRVPDEIRLVLGIAGLSCLAMIGSIPLLSQMERFSPRSMTA